MKLATALLIFLLSLISAGCGPISINNEDEVLVAEGRRTVLMKEAERQGVLNQDEKERLAQEREDQQAVMDATRASRIAGAIKKIQAEAEAGRRIVFAKAQALDRLYTNAALAAVVFLFGLALVGLGFGLYVLGRGATQPMVEVAEAMLLPKPIDAGGGWTVVTSPWQTLQGTNPMLVNKVLPGVAIWGEKVIAAPGSLPAIGAQVVAQIETTKHMALAAGQVGAAQATGAARVAALDALHSMVKDILDRPRISVIDGSEIIEA